MLKLLDLVIADRGGMVYLLLALLVLGLYWMFLIPVVNEAEGQLLKTFAKKEIHLLLVLPLILSVLWLSKELRWYTNIVFIVSLAYYSFTQTSVGVKSSVINQAMFVGYFFGYSFLFLFLFGLFGPFKFDWVEESVRNPPRDVLYMAVKDGEFRMVNMAHGYLTYILYHYTPGWFLIPILSYVSQLEATASFRATLWFCMYLVDRVGTVIEFLVSWE